MNSTDQSNQDDRGAPGAASGKGSGEGSSSALQHLKHQRQQQQQPQPRNDLVGDNSQNTQSGSRS